MSLFQIKTNLQSSRLRFSLMPEEEGVFVDVPLATYEGAMIEREDLGGQNIRVLELPKSYSVPEIVQRWSVQAHSGNKQIPEKNIPDVWTTNPFAMVSEKAKNVIETMDPDIHRFVPIDITDRSSGTPMDAQKYFLFLCGRAIEIDPSASPIDPTKTDIFGLVFPSPVDAVPHMEARIYNAIASESSIQDTIENFPIWRFNTRAVDGVPFGQREIFYANNEFLKSAKKAKLKGVAETSGVTKRDVNHVWY